MEDASSGSVQVRYCRPKDFKKLKKQLGELDQILQGLGFQIWHCKSILSAYMAPHYQKKLDTLQKRFDKLDRQRYRIRMKLKGYHLNTAPAETNPQS